MTYLITERIAIQVSKSNRDTELHHVASQDLAPLYSEREFHEYTKQMLDSNLGIQVFPCKPIKNCQARAT